MKIASNNRAWGHERCNYTLFLCAGSLDAGSFLVFLSGSGASFGLPGIALRLTVSCRKQAIRHLSLKWIAFFLTWPSQGAVRKTTVQWELVSLLRLKKACVLKGTNTCDKVHWSPIIEQSLDNSSGRSLCRGQKSTSSPGVWTLCHWSNSNTNLWECVVVITLVNTRQQVSHISFLKAVHQHPVEFIIHHSSSVTSLAKSSTP